MKKWEEDRQLKLHSSKVKQAKPRILSNSPSLSKLNLATASAVAANQASSPLSHRVISPPSLVAESAVFKHLRKYNLQQYAKKFFDAGYGEDLSVLGSLSPAQVDALLNNFNVLPGHSLKLKTCLDSLKREITDYICSPNSTKKSPHPELQRGRSGPLSSQGKGKLLRSKSASNFNQNRSQLVSQFKTRHHFETDETDDLTSELESPVKNVLPARKSKLPSLGASASSGSLPTVSLTDTGLPVNGSSPERYANNHSMTEKAFSSNVVVLNRLNLSNQTAVQPNVVSVSSSSFSTQTGSDSMSTQTTNHSDGTASLSPVQNREISVQTSLILESLRDSRLSLSRRKSLSDSDHNLRTELERAKQEIDKLTSLLSQRDAQLEKLSSKLHHNHHKRDANLNQDGESTQDSLHDESIEERITSSYDELLDDSTEINQRISEMNHQNQHSNHHNASSSSSSFSTKLNTKVRLKSQTERLHFERKRNLPPLPPVSVSSMSTSTSTSMSAAVSSSFSNGVSSGLSSTTPVSVSASTEDVNFASPAVTVRTSTKGQLQPVDLNGPPVPLLKHRGLANSVDTHVAIGTISDPDLDEIIRCVSICLSQMMKQNASADTSPRKETVVTDVENQDITIAPIKKKDGQTVLERFADIFSEERAMEEKAKQDIGHNRLAVIGRRRPLPPESISIYNYVRNIVVTVRMETECNAICIAYIERLVLKTGFSLTADNWKRITLTSLLLASKVWDDDSYENGDFAYAFPLFSLAEINEMERSFLQLLDYDLSIKASDYAKYYFLLRTYSQKDSESFPLKPLDITRAKHLQKKCQQTEYSLRNIYGAPLAKTL
eukprot:GILJ01006732.1.p1 GENE.GILJ01006732.1~~GILJ01006732.1.p1  ORF type:complete len:834 (-),score=139.69 GILJ01006732.1:217-2718(-)